MQKLKNIRDADNCFGTLGFAEREAQIEEQKDEKCKEEFRLLIKKFIVIAIVRPAKVLPKTQI